MTPNAETGLLPKANPVPTKSATSTDHNPHSTPSTVGSTVTRMSRLERATRRVARAQLDLEYAVAELTELVKAESGA